MAIKKKKAVTKKKATPPPAVINRQADAGKGAMENADKDSLAIPFLVVLQSGSPQLDTVPDAKAGMLLNSITEELFEEVLVVPCAFQRQFIKWAPREDGGGFKGTISPADVDSGNLEGMHRDDDKGLMIGNDLLKDTRNHFVLLKSDDSGLWSPAVLSLASTQVKKSKKWMSLIQGVQVEGDDGLPYNPASYSYSYVISTVKEENAKGKWFGVSVIIDEATDDALYTLGRNFCIEVTAGDVKTQEPVDNNKSDEDF